MPTPDEIERSLLIPEELASAVFSYRAVQDAARGDWVSPRDSDQPDEPWPSRDNDMLRFLLKKADLSLKAGMDTRTALLQLAVHAWFEGGIENYDRGQRDARRPRPAG